MYLLAGNFTVIGRGGEQISQIQSQTNCRVQMSPESDANRMRQCTLQGSKMSVDRARAMIQEVSCNFKFYSSISRQSFLGFYVFEPVWTYILLFEVAALMSFVCLSSA